LSAPWKLRPAALRRATTFLVRLPPTADLEAAGMAAVEVRAAPLAVQTTDLRSVIVKAAAAAVAAAPRFSAPAAGVL